MDVGRLTQYQPDPSFNFATSRRREFHTRGLVVTLVLTVDLCTIFTFKNSDNVQQIGDDGSRTGRTTYSGESTPGLP